MRIGTAAALAAMGITALAAPVGAQREGAWLGVGTRTLGDTGTQIYEVRGTSVPREIMFCVDGGNVQLVSAEVRFRSGDNRAVRLATRVRAGRCSSEYTLAQPRGRAGRGHRRLRSRQPCRRYALAPGAGALGLAQSGVEQRLVDAAADRVDDAPVAADQVDHQRLRRRA